MTVFANSTSVAKTSVVHNAVILNSIRVTCIQSWYDIADVHCAADYLSLNYYYGYPVSGLSRDVDTAVLMRCDLRQVFICHWCTATRRFIVFKFDQDRAEFVILTSIPSLTMEVDLHLDMVLWSFWI